MVWSAQLAASALLCTAGGLAFSPPSICSGRGRSPLARPAQTATSALAPQATSDEYEALRGIEVQKASTGERLALLDAWTPSTGSKTIVAFFTHTADFNSWEYAEQLRHYLPQIDDAGAKLVGVTIGDVRAAKLFCTETGFPLDNLYLDEEGAAYSALGFSAGFDPRLPGDKKLNPYLRLLPMLAGIGSPGTIQEVLRGYTGDRSADLSWTATAFNIVSKDEFDILGREGARPLELATLRLQNMRQILGNWNVLCPANMELITQQGGTIVFDGRETVFQYKDKGILVYSNIKDVLQAVGAKS